MQWFRRHRLFGAQAALFAFVVQFVVAFGHVHALGHHGSAPTAALASIGSDQASSTGDHGTNHPGDFCDICATIHLIGSAQAAAAPALPVPIVFAARAPSIASDFASGDVAYFEHRSRGPPQV